MTSGRPYRSERRFSLEASLIEMRRCRGTQFDPDVLDAFLGAIGDGTIVVPEESNVEAVTGSA